MKQSNNFLTISTQSESSREYNPSWKTNEVNLIKTKLEEEDISRTWHICYIRSKAAFAGRS